MRDDPFGRVAVFHLDEVRWPSGNADADIGERAGEAEEDLLLDDDVLGSDALTRGVAKSTEVAAHLLEKEPDFRATPVVGR
jgi:hypothetical protein